MQGSIKKTVFLGALIGIALGWSGPAWGVSWDGGQTGATGGLGDANGDGLVDSADLALWQQYYEPLGGGATSFAIGDWNDDGMIDSADLALWQQYYDPIGVTPPAQHAPEPLTMLAVFGGLAAVGAYLRKRRTA